jgi:hypothetical protein
VRGRGAESDHGWLDLEQIATVEATSEDPAFPIESVFGSRDGPGWRAAAKGEQHRAASPFYSDNLIELCA